MKSYDTDPGGGSFSGEPASFSDTAIIEGLAWQLLEAEPYELVRCYERCLEDVAKVEFSVTETQECGKVTMCTGIAISSEDDEEPCFRIMLGPNNTLAAWHSPTSDHLRNAADLAGSLLDAVPLDPREYALINHVRELIYLLEGEILPASANMVETGHGKREPMASLIRYLVKEADPPAMQVKEFGHVIDDTHTLTIIEQKIAGTIDPIDLLAFSDEPELQVEYEDRGKRTNHCYVVTIGGHRSYEQYDPADLLEMHMADTESAADADFDDNNYSGELPLPKAGAELLKLVMTEVLMLRLVPETFSMADIEAANSN